MKSSSISTNCSRDFEAFGVISLFNPAKVVDCYAGFARHEELDG